MPPLCCYAAKGLTLGIAKKSAISTRIIVLCRFAAKVLTLGIAKKSAIFFAFHSLNRTFANGNNGL